MSDYSDIKQSVSLRDYASQNLQHVQGGLVCPCCSSGTGPKKTPAFSIKGERWLCFACGSKGDIFDLAGAIHHTDDKKEQLAYVKQWAGVTDSKAAPAPKQPTVPQEPTTVIPEGKQRNRRYIQACQAAINDPKALEYLSSRGIDEIRAKHEGFGYDPTAKRVVIPWQGCDYYWIARDITGTSERKYIKPKTSEVGAQPLWNSQALKKDAYFVVEGPMDALAIGRTGHHAIALGGVGTGELVEEALRTKSRACAIFMFDTDDAGQKAQQRARTAFEKAGLAYIEYQGERYAKDADEMWRCDPERLASQLAAAELEASDLARQIESERQIGLFRTLRPADTRQIARELMDSPQDRPYVPTGIDQLDAMLDGGLRTGLHVLAAASSIGKTTLATQIADAIALSGRTVLYVTLEQSAKELVAKSVARLAYRASSGKEAIPVREMCDRHARAQWDSSRSGAFTQALERYEDGIAPSTQVLEGVGRTSAVDIAGYAACLAERGQAPVVFVDYLQLLSCDAVQDERISIARNISDLRQLARDLEVPVVCISSVRRDAYLMPVTLDSMKESGAIEYGADTVLGLQVAGVDMGRGTGPDRKAKSDADRASRSQRAAQRRDVELVVLKQRDGRVHGPDQAIRLTFLPQASVFL